MDISKLFDKYEKEFLEFDKIENKLSNRPDLCGFLFLDKLFSRNRDLVSSAEHDQIWLDIDMKEFEKVVTDEIVIYLSRCGIFYDDEALSMFV